MSVYTMTVYNVRFSIFIFTHKSVLTCLGPTLRSYTITSSASRRSSISVTNPVSHSSGINWITLDPDVVINRFPRDTDTALKLCGYSLANKSEFDVHYPSPEGIPCMRLRGNADRSFVADYSLIARVSLLRAFVDGDHRAMCSKSVKVSIPQSC